MAKTQQPHQPTSLEILSALIKLDLDASRGYEQALKRAVDESVREQLGQCYDDHLAHKDRLENAIIGLGGKPPVHLPQLHGFFPDPLGALRKMKSDDEILNVLVIGERVTNRTYEEALKLEMPHHVRNILEENYQDERVHLDFVRKTLRVVDKAA